MALQLYGEDRGRYATTCRLHLGGTLCYARQTRGGFFVTCGSVVRDVEGWSRGSGRRLRQMCGHMAGTGDYVLSFTTPVPMGDMAPKGVYGETLADLDLAGCVDTMRSTAGGAYAVRDDACDVMVHVGWAARRCDIAYRSATHAEASAANEIILRVS